VSEAPALLAVFALMKRGQWSWTRLFSPACSVHNAHPQGRKAYAALSVVPSRHKQTNCAVRILFERSLQATEAARAASKQGPALNTTQQ